MTTIVTGSFAKALWPGVSKWFDESKAQHEKEFDKIFEIRKSKRAWEELIGHSTLGLPVQKGPMDPAMDKKKTAKDDKGSK